MSGYILGLVGDMSGHVVAQAGYGIGVGAACRPRATPPLPPSVSTCLEAPPRLPISPFISRAAFWSDVTWPVEATYDICTGMQILDTDTCEVKQVDAGLVAEVSRRVDPEEASRLADLFRLLGDATRARILFALLEAGELCVCDIAEAVDTPESTVSHALRLLRTAGIVRNRRSGRMIHYSLDDSHVRMLLDLSISHLRHGDVGQ